MRDKLIELIKSRRDPCDIGACPFTADDVRPCSLCETESLAEHLISHGVTVGDVPETNVGKWIAVSERLPNDGEDVLLYDKNFAFMDIGTYYKVGSKGSRKQTPCFTVMGHKHPTDDYTHWMPLPEPPKEGNNE